MMHTKGSNSPTMANPRVTGRPILFLAVILVAGCLLLYLYQRNIVARGKARFAEQALGRTVAKLTECRAAGQKSFAKMKALDADAQVCARQNEKLQKELDTDQAYKTDLEAKSEKLSAQHTEASKALELSKTEYGKAMEQAAAAKTQLEEMKKQLEELQQQNKDQATKMEELKAASQTAEEVTRIKRDNDALREELQRCQRRPLSQGEAGPGQPGVMPQGNGEMAHAAVDQGGNNVGRAQGSFPNGNRPRQLKTPGMRNAPILGNQGRKSKTSAGQPAADVIAKQGGQGEMTNGEEQAQPNAVNNNADVGQKKVANQDELRNGKNIRPAGAAAAANADKPTNVKAGGRGKPAGGKIPAADTHEGEGGNAPAGVDTASEKSVPQINPVVRPDDEAAKTGDDGPPHSDGHEAKDGGNPGDQAEQDQNGQGEGADHDPPAPGDSSEKPAVDANVDPIKQAPGKKPLEGADPGPGNPDQHHGKSPPVDDHAAEGGQQPDAAQHDEGGNDPNERAAGNPGNDNEGENPQHDDEGRNPQHDDEGGNPQNDNEGGNSEVNKHHEQGEDPADGQERDEPNRDNQAGAAGNEGNRQEEHLNKEEANRGRAVAVA